MERQLLPTVSSREHHPCGPNSEMAHMSVTQVMRGALLPTCGANEYKGSAEKPEISAKYRAQGKDSLPRTIKEASLMLPTPTTMEHLDKRPPRHHGRGCKPNLTTTLMLPTCTASDSETHPTVKMKQDSPNSDALRASAKSRNYSDAPIYLNPSFAELVMGFPQDWTTISAENALKLLETQSSRKSRKSSEK
jgi:hypothetical protein